MRDLRSIQNRVALQGIFEFVRTFPCVKAPSLLCQSPHQFVSEPPYEMAQLSRPFVNERPIGRASRLSSATVVPVLEANDLVTVPLSGDAGSGNLKHNGGQRPVAAKPIAIEGA